MEIGTIKIEAGAINCIGEQPVYIEPTPIEGFVLKEIYGVTIAIPEDATMYVWNEETKSWN